jgi:CspA family cold shock protein
MAKRLSASFVLGHRTLRLELQEEFTAPSRRVPEMAYGTVARFNDATGFGFITLDNGGKAIFVHYCAIVSSNRESLWTNSQLSFLLDGTRMRHIGHNQAN